MRLLFLAKRHPQQRDLIERPYGRFFHLPAALAELGHDVAVTLCSHRAMAAQRFERAGVDWASEDVRTSGPLQFLRSIEERAKAFRPDWVVGCSDAWYGPLARRLAVQCNARLAVDAYDNYDAYMPWNLPLHWIWHHSIRTADAATAAGPQLAELLDRYRPGRRPTDVVPMAADPVFSPCDKMAAREALGLPRDSPLVGYFGSWAENRGTDVLLHAFRLIRSRRPDARLIMTGSPPATAVKERGGLPLGYIADADLPVALAALDVALVITADTPFGRFSYPAKLYEAMACQVPLVATDTAPVRWILSGNSALLVPVGDASAVAERALALLDRGPVRYAQRLTWQDSAAAFEAALWAASAP